MEKRLQSKFLIKFFLQKLIKKAVKNIRKLTINEKIEIIEKQKKIPEKKKK